MENYRSHTRNVDVAKMAILVADVHNNCRRLTWRGSQILQDSLFGVLPISHRQTRIISYIDVYDRLQIDWHRFLSSEVATFEIVRIESYCWYVCAVIVYDRSRGGSTECGICEIWQKEFILNQDTIILRISDFYIYILHTHFRVIFVSILAAWSVAIHSMGSAQTDLQPALRGGFTWWSALQDGLSLRVDLTSTNMYYFVHQDVHGVGGTHPKMVCLVDLTSIICIIPYISVYVEKIKLSFQDGRFATIYIDKHALSRVQMYTKRSL